jgi:hypothetical protein
VQNAYKLYNAKYPYTVDGVTVQTQMCKPFISDFGKELYLNNGIKYLIIILNTVIRMVVIAIITRMGCSTESTQLIYITNMVFICQFFNTGILPMLCTANLEGQLPPKIISALGLTGGAKDFNQTWFLQVGDTIQGSMVFNTYFGIGMEMVWLTYRWTFRLLDMKGTTD